MLKLMYTLLLAGVTSSLYACDICGCSAGGNYFGILPRFQKNFVGLRYQYRSFDSRPHTSAEDFSGSRDRFQTIELWGKYVPHNRVQLFAFLPYQDFKRKEGSAITRINGLGDITLLANFILINTGDSIRKKWKQALLVGGGIKLPAGRYDLLREGLMLNPNLQPGTGSWDFPLNMTYTLRRKKVGINSEISYSINTANKQHYQFGDRLNTSMRFFYWKKFQSISVIPQAGLAYEKAEANRSLGKTVDFTGSKTLLAQAGIDLYYKNLVLGLNGKCPVAETNGGGYVNSHLRISANLLYLF